VWVTLYADASFNRAQGGAWAVWLRSARGRIVRSGKCPPYVRDANSAELAAIYAGVYLACRAWPQVVRGLLVRSDSQTALRLTEPSSDLSKNPASRALQRKLRALVGAKKLVVQCRWVQGHQPKKRSTAAYLNGACDARAKGARRTRG
jgi:ribonuclease HI